MTFNGRRRYRLLRRGVFGNGLCSAKNAVPKTYAFAFSTGYPVAGGYIGGFQLAEYNVLNGKVLVNALNIADSLTARPAADKILKNLLK